MQRVEFLDDCNNPYTNWNEDVNIFLKQYKKINGIYNHSLYTKMVNN